MGKVVAVVAGVVLVVGLGVAALVFAGVEMIRSQTPVTAARRFETKLTQKLVEPAAKMPHPVPDSLYQRVDYQGPSGKLWAWMSRPPSEQKRHPAIVWITGGFPPGGLANDAWLEKDPRNDQSAAQYMRAGVITLYPTTRGMEGNAGSQESFLGEVADVVAAVQWLRAQPYVDSERVYVGGHSTGGTLSLLVGASTDVSGVISYGPVADVCGYEQAFLAFDSSSPEECFVRAPLTYANRLPSSVIVEGEWANAAAVHALSRSPSKNASYVVVPRSDHFLYVGAMNEYFAQKIVKREKLTLTVEEARAIIERRFPPTVVEADDGWTVTVPADFEEDTPVENGRRVFINALATIIISLEEDVPVTCAESGAIKGRANECFASETKGAGDSAEIYFTAQRGSALFVTVGGLKSQEKTLLGELNYLLDTAKAPSPSH